MKVLQQVTIINKAVEYSLNRAKMENDRLAVFNAGNHRHRSV